jgi:glutathione S-transferase
MPEMTYIQLILTRISAEKCLIAAKYGGAAVKVGDFELGKTNKSNDFLQKFPFGKVPAYEGDGVTLSESNAIAQYRTYPSGIRWQK